MTMRSSRLRTMDDGEFESLPFGSEGLWRKLMHAARSENTLERNAAAVKSKRYTRSRIDRMILCAFLGITEADMASHPACATVLALNEKGGKVLKKARKTGLFPNIGEKSGCPCDDLERKYDALYGLFAQSDIEAAGSDDRVYYHSV